MNHIKRLLYFYTLLLAIDVYMYVLIFILIGADPISQHITMHVYESALKIARYITCFTGGFSIGLLFDIGIAICSLNYKKHQILRRKWRSAEYEKH